MRSQVRDNGDLRKYRTEIPNMVDDMDLSVYAFRLYVHFKRVAGDSGECFQGTRTIAEACRMSVGKVSAAKQELQAAGLIEIDPREQWQSDLITIMDIWPMNFVRYADARNRKEAGVHVMNDCSHSEHPCSCGEHPCSCGEHPCSCGEQKKEPNKKEPNKKEPEEEVRAAQPPTPAPPGKKGAKIIKSPHFSNEDFEGMYIPAGQGQNPVQVYYERFNIFNPDERLTVIKEDDLNRQCPDLERLREVVTAYSRTAYKPGNIGLILDWYHGGVRQRGASSTGRGGQDDCTNQMIDNVAAQFRAQMEATGQHYGQP